MASETLESVSSIKLGGLSSDVQEKTEQIFQEALSDVKLDDSMLSEAEKKEVADFAARIDLRNTQDIIQYGSNVQQKMADFSENTLNQVRTKDLGAVGELLTLVDEADTCFLGFFKRQVKSLDTIKARYDKAENNIAQICNTLENHQVTLLKDVAMFDKMYELNLQSYKEITMYILAGKQKLDEIRKGELAELQRKAAESGLAEDAQAAKDLADQCNRFEKKLYDLNLTRTISQQTAPQIRLLQGSDTQMAEKIQSVLVNTIPLWKNQMVITLGIAHSTEAIAAENAVTNATNELLQANAQNLKTASVAAAKANERGIVDIDTLKKTNETLLSTLDEVLKIQEEGKQARHQAEKELQKIEGELKNKLLEMSQK